MHTLNSNSLNIEGVKMLYWTWMVLTIEKQKHSSFFRTTLDFVVAVNLCTENKFKPGCHHVLSFFIRAVQLISNQFATSASC